MRHTLFRLVPALVMLPVFALAQAFSVTPASVRQGEVFHLDAPPAAASATLAGRTVPLFPQGLMPVSVLAKPGTYNLEWLNSQGAVIHSQSVVVRNAHYPAQNIVLSKALTNLHSTPEERDDVGTFLKQQSAVRYWREPLQPPIPGCITSPFGVNRLHNGKPTGDFHAGLDQRGAAGTPIRAITAGDVKIAQQFALRGGTVAIDHGQGMQSIYLHMSKIAAQPGTHVQAGDIVGYVGSTGRSTGPHLHWTMYVYGEPVSPLQWVQLLPCVETAKK